MRRLANGSQVPEILKAAASNDENAVKMHFLPDGSGTEDNFSEPRRV